MTHPCGRDCPKRTAECRKTCEAWAAYEAWKFADYKRRKKLGEESSAVNTLEVKRYRRGARR